ncbi:hypothetical protein HPB52_013472 [Rhipicephalus sanguineus]|uniref:Uncharacterized protein n=1 Tax=Rhipicephalus sanguineus TaxID=34632 RepID=A0A9D4PXC8_RHISA|nr:hypothetical protein HPB52_013472 [Rhipicephalus sanguineus]
MVSEVPGLNASSSHGRTTPAGHLVFSGNSVENWHERSRDVADLTLQELGDRVSRLEADATCLVCVDRRRNTVFRMTGLALLCCPGGQSRPRA